MDNANELNQQQDTSQAQNQNETVQVQQQNPAQDDSKSLRAIALYLKSISDNTESIAKDVRIFRIVMITIPIVIGIIVMGVMIILFARYGSSLY